MADDDDDDPGLDHEAVTALAITDELDLHPFRPGEVGSVVTEYVGAAQEAGLTRVRIIHGKGVGHLRRTVHAALARHPAVVRFALADERSGGWGATLVELRAAPGAGPAPL
ncbi:MAG: Smr/MutS family protein [Kofleriaceae bacterium]|nr:Smr/MutS family protein [Kofleriaceae bacterium]